MSFWSNPESQENYYQFWRKFTRLESSIHLLEIDFQKPWWSVLGQVKYWLASSLMKGLVLQVYVASMPLMLGYIFAQEKYDLLGLVFLGYALVRFFMHVGFRYDALMAYSIDYSLKYHA